LCTPQAFKDEANEVGAAKKAQRAADKAARNPDDVQLTVFQKVLSMAPYFRQPHNQLHV
jgi:hypothetical protein